MPSKKRIFLDRASTAAFGFGQRAFLRGSIVQAEKRGERLAIALRLHELSCNLAREGIRQQHPSASESEVEQKLRERLQLAYQQ